MRRYTTNHFDIPGGGNVCPRCGKEVWRDHLGREIDPPEKASADLGKDLSIPNLERLIATMSEWNMKPLNEWTPAEMAAHRLKWFGRTPEQDRAATEEFQSQRERELRDGFDRYREREREPFIDWPNSQGTYD